MLAVQSYVPVVLVSNSPESYLPLALIFSTTELVTSVSHFSSENSLKVILPSPVGSTRPEIVAVSLIFSPTVTDGVASVVISGVAGPTTELSLASLQDVLAASLFLSPEKLAVQ